MLYQILNKGLIFIYVTMKEKHDGL